LGQTLATLVVSPQRLDQVAVGMARLALEHEEEQEHRRHHAGSEAQQDGEQEELKRHEW
jgi:hypothetical protein